MYTILTNKGKKEKKEGRKEGKKEGRNNENSTKKKK